MQSIDSVLVDNQYIKRLTFYGSFSQREVIEGIGCTKGLFFPLQYTFEDYQLLTCYEDSNLFWTNPELQGIDCFSVGIEENHHDSYKVLVYPNPATKQITLGLGSQNQMIETLNIFTITGQKAGGLNNVNSSKTINIQELKSGVYLLEGVLESGESFVGKFVKE